MLMKKKNYLSKILTRKTSLQKIIEQLTIERILVDFFFFFLDINKTNYFKINNIILVKKNVYLTELWHYTYVSSTVLNVYPSPGSIIRNVKNNITQDCQDSLNAVEVR